MGLTIEQTTIVEHVSRTTGLTKVAAVAGSGKTTLLTHIARLPFVKRGLYLAYTKSVATEAQTKFPDTVTCCTTHSLAYGPTIKSYGFTLGELTHRDVNLPEYEDRIAVLNIFKEFCLSEHINFDEFVVDYQIPEHYVEYVQDLLTKVENKELPCSHTFYLKYFHILLATRALTYRNFDIIMLDEAGDINKVTLEIFKLLPAARKVMVGDGAQNIFMFNHTIDCFAAMQDIGESFPMTKSFRVSSHIAKRIQHFCNLYIDKDMKFTGVELQDPVARTKAFIARTNASLIEHIIYLNKINRAYALTRSPDRLFEQVRSFLSLRYKGFIPDPSLRYLQLDVDAYYETEELKRRHKNLFAYLLFLYPNNMVIKSNIALIAKFGAEKIMLAYSESIKHKSNNYTYVLGTAHSTKGLEYDEVELANDMNEAIEDIIANFNIAKGLGQTYVPTDNERVELNLYYVACSRARKALDNAMYLPRDSFKSLTQR